MRIGILDGYPVQKNFLSNYPMKTCFDPFLCKGVEINLLVPDGDEWGGGRCYQEQGYKVFTTAYYGHPLEIRYLVRFIYSGLFKPIEEFVRASDTVVLRVPSPIAPIVHIFSILYKRKIIPFFMGEWDRTVSAIPGLKGLLLHVPLTFWKIYHLSLVRFYATISTGPHLEHPNVRFGFFVPRIIASGNGIQSKHVLQKPANLLFVGRLTESKGILLLLDALVHLGDSYHLTVAGEGPLRQVMSERARALGIYNRISLLGQVNRNVLLRLYAESDVLVIPSFTEGVPKVLLEAIQLGVPVVATRVGGIPHLRGIEQCAVLISPSRVDALVSGILTVQSRLKSNGFSNCNPESLVRSYSAINQIMEILNNA